MVVTVEKSLVYAEHVQYIFLDNKEDVWSVEGRIRFAVSQLPKEDRNKFKVYSDVTRKFVTLATDEGSDYTITVEM